MNIKGMRCKSCSFFFCKFSFKYVIIYGLYIFLRKVNGDILSMKRTKIMIGGTSALTLMSLGVVDVYADETPKPTGNVIARGEDGVPWELYENGYLLFKPETGKDTLTNVNGDTSWKREYGAKIKHVGFTGKVYAPENSRYLFSKYTNTVANNNPVNLNFDPITLDTLYLDTSKVTNMYAMFKDLSNVNILDVTRFDTSKVTNMGSMFENVSKITNLDVTHFDTINVMYMNSMFKGMFNLKHLDVTHFNTISVNRMDSMFEGLSNLTELDVTKFNTSNVINMSAMFNGMSKLTNLDVTHFDTSKVWNMSFMFYNLANIRDIDVIHFNTSKTLNMDFMFRGMSNLTNLDVSHFDTSKVFSMLGMFENLSELTSLDISNFDTTKVKNMNNILFGLNKLKEIKIGDKFKGDGIRSIMIGHVYGANYTENWHKINDKAHPYSVQDWANAYNANPTAYAGTWVREERPQGVTLTFDGEKFSPVKFKPNSDAFPELPNPSKPKQNHNSEEVKIIDKAITTNANHTEEISSVIKYSSRSLYSSTARRVNGSVEAESDGVFMDFKSSPPFDKPTFNYTRKNLPATVNPVKVLYKYKESFVTPKPTNPGVKPNSDVELLPEPKKPTAKDVPVLTEKEKTPPTEPNKPTLPNKPVEPNKPPFIEEKYVWGISLPELPKEPEKPNVFTSKDTVLNRLFKVTKLEYNYVPTTYFEDEGSNQIIPREPGDKEKREFPNWKYIKTTTDKDGNRHHIYTKVKKANRLSNLFVNHYKEGTTEKVAESEEYRDHLIGSDYKTKPQTIKSKVINESGKLFILNYELVGLPNNKDGKYTEQDTVVNYYYKEIRTELKVSSSNSLQLKNKLASWGNSLTLRKFK